MRHLTHKQTVVFLRPHRRFVILRGTGESLGPFLDPFKKVFAPVFCEGVLRVFRGEAKLDTLVALDAESVDSPGFHLLNGPHELIFVLSLVELTFLQSAIVNG